MLFCDVAFFVKIFECIYFYWGRVGRGKGEYGKGKEEEGARISFLKCGFWESKGGWGGDRCGFLEYVSDFMGGN